MQPILSSKYESVLFLHSLACSTTKTPLIAPSLLPSLAPPPPITSKQTPIVSPIDVASVQPLRKGKSKAELLREVRARSGIVTDSSTRWPVYDMGNRTPTYPRNLPLERCVISSPRYIGKACTVCDRQRWKDRDEPSLHGGFCARHVMVFA